MKGGFQGKGSRIKMECSTDSMGTGIIIIKKATNTLLKIILTTSFPFSPYFLHPYLLFLCSSFSPSFFSEYQSWICMNKSWNLVMYMIVWRYFKQNNLILSINVHSHSTLMTDRGVPLMNDFYIFKLSISPEAL